MIANLVSVKQQLVLLTEVTQLELIDITAGCEIKFCQLQLYVSWIISTHSIIIYTCICVFNLILQYLNLLCFREDFAAAWMNLGLVQAALHKNSSAKRSYYTAIKHRKKYPDCYYNLGNMVSFLFIL